MHVGVIPVGLARLNREARKGSAELLILALVEERPRHGDELGSPINRRSHGVLSFHIASLYPTLYRLEKRWFIAGRWIEQPGQRRRRDFRITPPGRRMLAGQRGVWSALLLALVRVAGVTATQEG
jgi:PadR family transcriptional regulator, regulatory protein PadR